MKIQEDYAADRPIQKKEDDRFQRHTFSERIADTIIERKNKDSIVYSLFGAWGEGKSTIINFIKSSIEAKSDDIIQVTFNPWRFADETSLLTSFFNSLAREIKKAGEETKTVKTKDITPSKSIIWIKNRFKSKEEPLKTGLENVGDMVQKYGGLISFFGADKTADAVGKMMSNVDLDKLKLRIEDLLRINGKKVVVYIDDIDRLDKTEIHAIFRLVKLTGDFAYTTYVLAFDEQMVASAIGERFGSGDKKAGESFLEKIIQIPINIPKAQPEALKKFCFALVEKALNDNNIDISETEVQRFVYQFSTNILERLDTPRLAVRYGNSLSFTLPLLIGEVNIVDLMLIEALKTFYPNYYQFVKSNPDYFIGSYQNRFDNNRNQKKIDEIKSHFTSLGESLGPKEDKQVRDLLRGLFPMLEVAFGNRVFSNETYNDWYVQKKIVSAKYFDRYFSYTVIEGDISDVSFNEIIESIPNSKVDEVAQKLKILSEDSEPGNVIHKLRSIEKTFDWQETKILSKSVCHITDLLPNEGGIMGMGYDNPYGQASIFIYQMLKNHLEEKELFDFAKELLEFSKDFQFAYKLNNWFRSGNRLEDKIFDEQQLIELAHVLTERAIKESRDKSFYEVFPNQASWIAHAWFEKDKESFSKYVKAYLDKNPENIVSLIESYVPMVRSSSRPDPYKGDLSKEGYEFLIKLYSKDDLYKRIIALKTNEILNEHEVYWDEFGSGNYAELNLLRQFIHWYRE